MSALDHDRFWWNPDQPEVVLNSGGGLRPRRAPFPRVLIHYAGAGTAWLDAGDTAQEVWSVELYARNTGKPNEYNAVVDAQGQTVEYAGPFQAAHNGPGNWGGTFGNSDSFGILCLYGLEDIGGADADRMIAGVLKARRQAVEAGWVTADHEVGRHGDHRRGGTACPGPLGNGEYWDRISGPYTVTSNGPVGGPNVAGWPPYDPPRSFSLWPVNSFKPVLYRTERNEAVQYLEDVISKWTPEKVVADGLFGRGTELAVMDIQGVFGLKVDGIVGDETWPFIDFLAVWPR